MSGIAVLRRVSAFAHLWLGLYAGAAVCLIALSGAIVTFRPQIATALSPPARQGACNTPIDWTRAQQQVEAATGSGVNRIYAPTGDDPRYHFRKHTPTTDIYTHVIYDACAGAVLGTARLEWLDWIVDLHHNLLAERTGRQVVGAIGVVLLVSSLSGALLVLLARPTLRRLFTVNTGNASRASYDLHRVLGAVAVLLLTVQAVTGSAVSFGAAFRWMVGTVASVGTDPRPGRATKDAGGTATLGAVLAAAETAIPGARVREIRMPGGYGTVQVRMWKTGDFRSLGNNVAFVDRGTARVLAVDRYDDRPGGSRFLQAMAGLHYAEWGGLTYRVLYGLTGAVVAPLFVTGAIFWWSRRRVRASRPRPANEPSTPASPLPHRV